MPKDDLVYVGHVRKFSLSLFPFHVGGEGMLTPMHHHRTRRFSPSTESNLDADGRAARWVKTSLVRTYSKLFPCVPIVTLLVLFAGCTTWQALIIGDIALEARDYALAIEHYTKAIRSDPSEDRAFHGRGLAYAYTRQFDRAIQDHTEALRLSRIDARRVKYLLTRGLIYEFKGAYDLAIRDYDQVLQLNPRDERAIMQLGRAYARQGSYNRAIQYYDELIRLLPDCDWCFSSRGGLYRAKGEYDRAIQDYDRALQLNPRSVVATASRGMAMFEQGQFAPAERHLTHAWQLNPKCIQCNILRYLAQARGGQDSSSSLSSLSTNADRNKWPDLIAFLYLGKVTAEAVLEAATDPDPMEQLNKQCSAYFYIGESLLIQGQTDEAVRLFRAAVEIKAFDVAECIAAKAELKRLGY